MRRFPAWSHHVPQSVDTDRLAAFEVDTMVIDDSASTLAEGTGGCGPIPARGLCARDGS